MDYRAENKKKGKSGLWLLAAVAVISVVITCFLVNDRKSKDSIEVFDPYTLTESTVYERAEGYGLYIDGEFVAATDNPDNAKNAVDELLVRYMKDITESKYIESSFCNTVNIAKGKFAVESFCDEEQIKKLLGLESPIALSHSLKSVNGSNLNTKLSVRFTTTKKEENILPFETVPIYSADRAKGYEKVIVEGETGLAVTESKFEYVDGVLASKTIMSVKTQKYPVDKKIVYGTNSHKSYFAWPYRGRITSKFGGRILFGKYNFHNGLDIAGYGGKNCYGDPVKAGANGRVIVANKYNNGPYGKYIVIKHPNGYESYYAHLSQVNVEVGDRIYEGDIIGKIGSTGKSTGPHLHFGVRINGQFVDPLKYLD